jgi:nitrite reductase/ring-hydroxylating ferredoxin subunit
MRYSKNSKTMKSPKSYDDLKQPVRLATLQELPQKEPLHAKVLNTDLVIIRYGDQVSVLYGRCLHRGALLSDGVVEGENLICGLHNWDYRIDTGVSEYAPNEILHKFQEVIHQGEVFVGEEEVAEFEKLVPSRFKPDQ